eukprot:483085-Prymnesium_polylepis.1
MLHLPIPADARSTRGQHYLHTRFFLWAVGQPFSWVGVAEDDTLFNMSNVMQSLLPYSRLRYAIYAPQMRWHMWHTVSLSPTC